MTREEIIQALALAEACSDGNWVASSEVVDINRRKWEYFVKVGKSESNRTIVFLDGSPSICNGVAEWTHNYSTGAAKADVELMAASRTLVPKLATALLDAVDRTERAEAKLDKATSLLDDAWSSGLWQEDDGEYPRVKAWLTETEELLDDTKCEYPNMFEAPPEKDPK